MQKELFKELVSDMEYYTHLEFEGDHCHLILEKMQKGYYLSISDRYFNHICSLFFDKIDFNTKRENNVFFRKNNNVVGAIDLKGISPRKIKVA